MKLKSINKKGVFQQLGALGIGVVTLMIILVIGFLIMSQGRAQAADIEGLDYSIASNCSSSVTCNATNTLTSAAATIPGWVPIVVIVSIGGLLLLLVRQFRQ